MPEAWLIGPGYLCSMLALAGLQYASLAPAAEPPASSRRNHGPSSAGNALAALCGIPLYSLFLLFSARPLTALILCLSLALLLTVLNRAKETVLREPLVLVDIWLLPQVFRYPELYLPFLPARRLAAGLALLALCIGLLLYLEPPTAPLRSATGLSLLATAVLLPAGLAVAMNRGHLQALAGLLLRLCPVSHDPAKDALANGPLASALLHPVLAGIMKRQGRDFLDNPLARPKDSRWPGAFEQSVLNAPEHGKRDVRPHVVLLQAESFWDIRPLLPKAQQRALAGFLPHWEALKAENRVLPTPENAFGAYTMRTEFSVLTGLAGKALGPWAFNPYLLAARRPMWSLARLFRQRGYSTVCLHPYHKRFFLRDRVMPHLGFERFLSLDELGGLERFGPYVSDRALGEEALSLLRQSRLPVFCFVITMEAHGPWLPGRLDEGQIARTLPDLDLSLFDAPLRLYLCHLRHMDELIGMFRKENKESIASAATRQSIVCAYGDHAPSLHFNL